MKRLLQNGSLLLVTLLITLIGFEICLRLFFPQYQMAAETTIQKDNLRIFARLPHEYYPIRHPDTGKPQPYFSNALALHQHREFDPARLSKTTKIGFFGDSFTDNHNAGAVFSLNEPLDYLLNQREDRFDVLNFGVNSYGTDQSYLYYRDSALAKQLDTVFYIFCSNDLRNILENKLFTINQAGQLQQLPAREIPLWIRLVAPWYTTYFILEVRARILNQYFNLQQGYGENLEVKLIHHHQNQQLESVKNAKPQPDDPMALEQAFIHNGPHPHMETVLQTFRLILRQWKQQVEAQGGRFVVVLLPRPEEGGAEQVQRLGIADDMEVINLYQLLPQLFPDVALRELFFIKDNHWNEYGNLLAARALYPLLEQRYHLTPAADTWVTTQLATYYAAFADRWQLPARWQAPVANENLQALRHKYSHLEEQLATLKTAHSLAK